jgi:hypothetical protein
VLDGGHARVGSHNGTSLHSSILPLKTLCWVHVHVSRTPFHQSPPHNHLLVARPPCAGLATGPPYSTPKGPSRHFRGDSCPGPGSCAKFATEYGYDCKKGINVKVRRVDSLLACCILRGCVSKGTFGSRACMLLQSQRRSGRGGGGECCGLLVCRPRASQVCTAQY